MKKFSLSILLTILFSFQVGCEGKPAAQSNQDGKCPPGHVLTKENSSREGLRTVGAKIKTVDKCMKTCTETSQCPKEVCHQFYDERDIELNNMQYILDPQELSVPKGICVNINQNTFEW